MLCASRLGEIVPGLFQEPILQRSTIFGDTGMQLALHLRVNLDD
jgi:hypothetical protein